MPISQKCANCGKYYQSLRGLRCRVDKKSRNSKMKCRYPESFALSEKILKTQAIKERRTHVPETPIRESLEESFENEKIQEQIPEVPRVGEGESPEPVQRETRDTDIEKAPKVSKVGEAKDERTCRGVTQSGNRCKHRASGNGYCRQHGGE